MSYRIVHNGPRSRINMIFTGSNTIPVSDFTSVFGVGGENIEEIHILKAIPGAASNVTISVARGSNVVASFSAGAPIVEYDMLGAVLSLDGGASLNVTFTGTGTSSLLLQLRKVVAS